MRWPSTVKLLREAGRGILATVAATRSAAGPDAPGVFVVVAVDTEGGAPTGGSPHVLRQPRPRLDWSAYERGGEVWALMNGWRERHRDATGRPLRVTWFVRFDRFLEAAGDRTQVYRALGRFRETMAHYGDTVEWHHHHMRWDDVRGQWIFDLDYTTNRDHEAALATMIRTTGSAPTAFRSGALICTPELHRWLEEVITFDYTLLVADPRERRRDRDDLNIHYDWSRAPNDWRFYRPAPDDYQTPGAGRRILIPCTPRVRMVEAAFARAAVGHPVILGISVHDYDPLRSLLYAFLRRCAECSRRYRVGYEFLSAAEAGRRVLALAEAGPPSVPGERRGGA